MSRCDVATFTRNHLFPSTGLRGNLVRAGLLQAAGLDREVDGIASPNTALFSSFEMVQELCHKKKKLNLQKVRIKESYPENKTCIAS